jgi:hypothetical protein
MHACKANTKTTRPSWNKEKSAVCVMQIFPRYELFYHLNNYVLNRLDFKCFIQKNTLDKQRINR